MPRPVAIMRLLLVLLVASFALQATGASAFIGDQQCQESCPDDDENGDCSPFCDDCRCCVHPRSIAPSLSASIAAPTVTGSPSFCRVVDSSEQAHARGIEHIPKPFLA